MEAISARLNLGRHLEERGPEEESAMLSSEPDPSGTPWAPTAQTEFF